MYNVQEIEENINLCDGFNGRFLYDEPLADKTTFKVGGSARIFVEPFDIKSFQNFVCLAKKMMFPFLVMGGGSNIVVPDEGISYPVLSTSGLKNISLKDDNRLVCDSGCTMESIVNFCLEHSLAGMERFAGLPGTIGGALFMNARCYDISISDLVDKVTYLDENTPGRRISKMPFVVTVFYIRICFCLNFWQITFGWFYLKFSAKNCTRIKFLLKW